MAVDFVGAGGGGKDSGGSSPVRNPDNLLAQDKIEFLLAISEGEIEGPADGFKSIEIGDTPLENPDGSRNFQDFDVTVHPGLDAYSAPFIFPKMGFGQGFNNQVGILLATDTPVTRFGEKSYIDFLEVRIIVNRLYVTNDQGMFNNNVSFRLEYKAASSPTWLPFYDESPIVHIIGQTTSNYPREYRRAVPRINEPYAIRVTKVSAANTTQVFSDISWESFQEIDAQPRQYANTALLHGAGKATDQLTSLPPIRGIYKGLLIRVPSNYDPYSKTYNGMWDGTWKKAWSDNNAFFLREVIMNDRWGWSAYRPMHVDDADFYAAGQWCDQRVGPDQKPRYTFNAYLTEAMNGREFARYVAGTFNATIFDDDNGNVLLRVDKAETPVVMFTPENVHGGQFEYSYTDTSVRYNDITVLFRNKELKYEEDRRRVYRQSDIDANGRIPLDFLAVGCTDAQEAMRRGFYKMLTAITETEFVSFKTNRIAATMDVWEMIYVSDPTMQYAMPGRIKSCSGNVITLRDPITLVPGVQYRIKVQSVTGLIDAAITSAGGTDILQLTVSTNLPSNIPDRTTFSIYGTDIGTPKPYRVLKIEEAEGDPDAVSVHAIEVNVNKWTDADNLSWSGEVDYQGIREKHILPPTGVGVRNGSSIGLDGTLFPKIMVDWSNSTSLTVSKYEIQWASEDRTTDWSQSYFSTGRTNWINIDVPFPTLNYVARVRAVSDYQSRASEWAYSTNAAMPGKDGIPNPPSGLIARPGVLLNALAWVLPGEPDIHHTEVWYNTVDVRPDPATQPHLLAGTSAGTTFIHFGLQANRTYYYWVRCIDNVSQWSNWNADAGVRCTTFEDNPAATPPAKITGLVLDTQVDFDAAVEPLSALIAAWTPSLEADFAGYEVATRIENETDWKIEIVPSNSYSALVVAGKRYNVKVRAYDIFQNRGEWSDIASIDSAIFSDYPAAPTGLTATVNVSQWGSNTIQRVWNINWNDSAPSDRVVRYIIAVRKNELTDWDFFGQQMEATESFLTFEEIGSKQGVETYQVRVRAVTRRGAKGPWSATVTATVANVDTPPAAPTNIKVEPGLRSFLISWTPPNDDRLDCVEVYVSESASRGPLTGVSRSGSYMVNELSAGSSRNVWLRSKNYAGQYSDFVGPIVGTAGTILVGDFGMGIPQAPSVPVLTTSTVVLDDGAVDAKLDITWGDTNNTDISFYQIEYRLGKTVEALSTATSISAGKAFAFSMSVRHGYIYLVRVRGVNFAGALGFWSSWVQIAIPGDTTPPSVPSSVTTSSATETIFLSWVNPIDPDFDYVEVYVGATNDPATRTPLWKGRATSYAHTGLPAGLTRYYWLRAVDDSGNTSPFTGPYSATASSLSLSAFPADLKPIQEVGALPTGAPTGVTTVRYQGRLYTWDGSRWVDLASTSNLTGTISATQLASGLAAVEIVPSLPTTGNFEGRQAFVGGKLYRFTGGGWVTGVAAGDVVGQLQAAQIAAVNAVSITGQISGTQITDGAVMTEKLAAQSVVAGKIATGAVQADNIAAGSVTASKMVIADASNMLLNPDFKGGSLDGWVVNNALISEAADNANDPLTGGRWRVQGHARVPLTWGQTFPVTAGDAYYVSGWVFNTAQERCGLMLSFSDSNGDNVFGNVFGAYTDVKSQWTFIEGIVQVPPNGLRMYFMCMTDHNGSASPTFWARLTLRRATSASLIVQGAILADKIAADAVTAGKIAAAAVNARELAAEAVTSDKVAANAITAGKIAANAVVAEKIAAGAVQADKVAANSITASKLAVVPNNLVADPFIQDDAYWTAVGSGFVPLDYTNPVVADMNVPRAFHVNYQGMSGNRWTYLEKVIPVEPNTEYVYELEARNDTVRAWADCMEYTAGMSYTGHATVTRQDGVVQALLASLISGKNRMSLKTAANTTFLKIRFGADSLNVTSGFVVISGVRLTKKTDGLMVVDGTIQTRHMTAGSIAADRLQAGSITGNLIAADTVLASSIITGTANNVVPDPQCRDPLFWFNSTQGTHADGDGLAFNPQSWWRTEGYVILGATGLHDYFTKFFPVRPGSKYLVRWQVYIYPEWQGRASFLLHQPAVAWNVIGAPSLGTWAEFSMPYQFDGAVSQKGQLLNFEAIVDNVDGQWGTRLQFRMSHKTTAGVFTVGGVEVIQLSGTSLIENGAITTDKLVASSVTTDKLATGSVTADKVSAGSLDVTKFASFSTGNMLANSDFSGGLECWNRVGTNVNNAPLNFGVNLDADWSLTSGWTMFAHQGNAQANGVWVGYYSHPASNWAGIPVDPTKTYEFSVYSGAHRCSVSIGLAWYNTSGTLISESYGEAAGTNDEQALGGRRLSDYRRLFVKASPPAGTATCRPIFVKNGTKSGYSDSYGFFALPLFGECAPNATDPQPWQPGGNTRITGPNIATGTITADKIAAGTITGDRILAGTIYGDLIGSAQVSTLKIAGNAVTVPVGYFGGDTLHIQKLWGDATAALDDYGTSPPIIATGQPVIVCASASVLVDNQGFTADFNYIACSIVRIMNYDANNRVALGTPDTVTKSIWTPGGYIANDGTFSKVYVDYPPAGAHVQYRIVPVKSNQNGVACTIRNVGIAALEAKR